MNFQTDEGGERASKGGKERRKAKKWRGRPRQGSLEPLSGWQTTHREREQNFRCSLAATAARHLAAASLPPPSLPSLLWAFTLHFTASCRFIFRPTDPTTSSSIENVAVARRACHAAATTRGVVGNKSTGGSWFSLFRATGRRPLCLG